MPFLFLGNAVWLDFINTQICVDGDRVDLLTGFDAVMQWAGEAGVLEPPERAAIDRRMPSRSERTALVEEARAVRSALREAAQTLLAGRAVPPRLVDRANGLMAAHPVVPSLERTGARWVTRSRPVQLSGGVPLARVAADFAGFLASGDTGKLRQCAGEGCVIMFVDRSKNHTRRWCSMETCGNRAKAATHRGSRKARAGEER